MPESSLPTSPPPLLQCRSLSKAFSGLKANDRINLSVEAGTLHAIIGPNGAGKTTLINLFSGELLPDSGALYFQGEDISTLNTAQRNLKGIARSYQINNVFGSLSVLENVMLVIQAKQGPHFNFWRSARRDPQLIAPALTLLEETHLIEKKHLLAEDLSYGDQRTLELTLAIASKPTLLLLDEPMAGISQENSSQMKTLLNRFKRNYTMVLIEHDMDILFDLADTLTVMVEGSVIASGPPKEIQQNPAVQQAYLGDEDFVAL